jgi:hypothetical protein
MVHNYSSGLIYWTGIVHISSSALDRNMADPLTGIVHISSNALMH